MRSLVFAILASCLFVPTAHAEEPKPTGNLKQDAASSGATELDDQGKFATVKEADEETDATEFDIALGGMVSTGNARSLAGTGVTKLRIRRGMHQFSAAGAGNYGRAAVDRESDPQTTVGNIQGQVRYDFFFAKRWAAFLMTTARHDPFQGLKLRLNVDPGFAFHILTAKNHRLWLEAGYDFQYDIREPEAIIERDDDGNPVLGGDGNTIRIAEDTRLNHAARLFAGYSNRLSEMVTLDTGLEYLQSVLKGSRWRLNFHAALSTQIAERFSLATTFTLRVDNDPLPDIAKVDTITAINLVYRFF